MRPVYVFFVKRKQDSQAWPLVFENAGRAQNYPDRVSEVVEVIAPDREMNLDGSYPQTVTQVTD